MRPRKPLNVLQLTGTASGKGGQPGRYKNRKHVPVDAHPLGRCPPGLTAEEKKAWKEIEKHCIDGVLGRADRLAVELCAKLVARMRQESVAHDARREKIKSDIAECDLNDAEEMRALLLNMVTTFMSVSRFSPSDMANMRNLLGQFAMMPGERQKFETHEPAKPKNKFSE